MYIHKIGHILVFNYDLLFKINASTESRTLGLSLSVIMINIIQIWTCDEGNMEFYGSEATILTKVKLRSILLLKIHKTHIAQHHTSIFALLYVKCVWFKHIGLWIHILLDSP